MQLIPSRKTVLKAVIIPTLIILAGCNGITTNDPPVFITGDVCLIPPAQANKEAKCFIYKTCKKWVNGDCKSWPLGFKKYIDDLSALKKTLEDAQPACPKDEREFNPLLDCDFTSTIPS